MTVERPHSRLRAFRVLLRVYPKAFTTRYREELERFFLEDHDAARNAGGGFWRARFWARTTLDTVRAALRLRAGASPGPVRDDHGDGLITRIADDIGHGVRMLVRHRRFSMGAGAVLAVGIGSTVAAFSVVDHILLRRLPYPSAERLVDVGMTFRIAPEMVGPLSEADFVAIQGGVSGLEAFGAVSGGSVVLTEPEGAARIDAARATEGYLEMLGARPIRGRTFAPRDHALGAPRVVVLSHSFWRNHLARDADVIGRVLTLDGEPFEVVGILRADASLPRGFIGEEAQVWIPLQLQDAPARGAFTLSGIGRLKPGVTGDALKAELDEVVRRRYPPQAPVLGGAVAPLRDRVLGQSGPPVLLALAGASLLLLMTCVNLAGLLLARGMDRQAEVAVRSALGARPGRVMLQLVSESLVLALAGGAAGVGVAFLAITTFKSLSPGNVPRLEEVSIDARILLATLGFSLLTGALFGLAPAVRQAFRLGAFHALQKGKSTVDRHHFGLGRALIAGEVGVAVLLALAAGLMANSYLRLTRVDPGFQPEGLLTLSLEMPRGSGSPDGWRARFEELVDRTRSLPGVSSVALTSRVPFTTDGMMARYVPRDVPAAEESVWVPRLLIGDGYFSTMGVPMVEGRALDARDGAGSDPVAVVNEAFVRTYWPAERSVLGWTVKAGTRDGDGPAYRVVGIAGNVLQDPGAPPEPQIFLSFAREPEPAVSMVVRASGDPSALAADMRALVRTIDPTLPITRLATMNDLARSTLVAPRFYALLIGSFGTLALLLALVGVYGVAAHQTRGRTREIGIRLALGAERKRIVRQMVGGAVIASMAGVVAGILAGLGATRVLSTFLFGIEPTDPATFAIVAGLVGLATAAAAYLPARRAVTLDPSTTLRVER